MMNRKLTTSLRPSTGTDHPVFWGIVVFVLGCFHGAWWVLHAASPNEYAQITVSGLSVASAISEVAIHIQKLLVSTNKDSTLRKIEARLDRISKNTRLSPVQKLSQYEKVLAPYLATTTGRVLAHGLRAFSTTRRYRID